MITKALLIGIQNYGLDGPHADIKNIEEYLREFNPEIRELIRISDAPGCIPPTKENIIDQLKRLYESVNENEDVFVYYSGHGDNLATTNSDEFDRRFDQAIRTTNGSIRDNDIHGYISTDMPSGTAVYAMFGCCHSGDILDLKYKLIDNEFQQIRDDSSINNKVILISGCAFMQSTTDAPSGGAFTNRFIDIMRGYKNKITYRILFGELDERLNYIEKYFGLSQDPQVFSSVPLDKDNNVF